MGHAVEGRYLKTGQRISNKAGTTHAASGDDGQLQTTRQLGSPFYECVGCMDAKFAAPRP